MDHKAGKKIEGNPHVKKIRKCLVHEEKSNDLSSRDIHTVDVYLQLCIYLFVYIRRGRRVGREGGGTQTDLCLLPCMDEMSLFV